MTEFIATLSPKKFENWDICKREKVWGVIGKGPNGMSNGKKVVAGDTIYIWRGGKPNGFIAKVEALGPMQLSGGPDLQIPWENPEDFGGVIPIRVISELPKPVSDSFSGHGRVGKRFGFNNTALQHCFEELEPPAALKIAEAFPVGSIGIGRSYEDPPPPRPTNHGQPFDIDPNEVDKALTSHHYTVAALASWVRERGWAPRLPLPSEPQYDLAWVTEDSIFVAEVKSTTDNNREMQLRLGLGQVIRYRLHLSDKDKDVRAWLVADQAVPDSSWNETCASVGVTLAWPGYFLEALDLSFAVWGGAMRRLLRVLVGSRGLSGGRVAGRGLG